MNSPAVSPTRQDPECARIAVRRPRAAIKIKSCHGGKCRFAPLYISMFRSRTPDDGFDGVVPVTGYSGYGDPLGQTPQPAQTIDHGLDYNLFEAEMLGKISN